MLLTDRRRLFGRREEDDERDASQGSLFAPDALAPPAARSPGTTPDPFAPTRARPDARVDTVEAPPADLASPADVAAAPADAAAAPVTEAAAGLTAAPAEIAETGYDDTETMLAGDDLAELEPVHGRVAAPRSVLTGPTLDDVMSRMWEGLRAEVPTPCPVCHAEIEPAAHGHCAACGSTLD